MTTYQFVALWGNGSAVKERRAINLEKGGTQGAGKIEGEGGGGWTRDEGVAKIRRADEGRMFISQFQLLKNHSSISQFYVFHFIIFSTWSTTNQETGRCLIPESVFFQFNSEVSLTVSSPCHWNMSPY